MKILKTILRKVDLSLALVICKQNILNTSGVHLLLENKSCIPLNTLMPNLLVSSVLPGMAALFCKQNYSSLTETERKPFRFALR